MPPAQPTTPSHPKDELLRQDRIPHIWCPGCGIGSAVSACITALQKSEISYDKFAVVSGIGCTGRVAGYLKLDSFHTTHGRAIPFATGLKLANQDLNVFVFSGEGDLFSIGGNHFIHAARRNMDLTVICVNNMNYGMTGGQTSANTPVGAKTTTSPYGNKEAPLNLPSLAAACGAVYVARWLSLDVRRLAQAISGGAAQARLLLCRGHRPLPDRLRPAQQVGPGQGHDPALPGQLGDHEPRPPGRDGHQAR